MPSAMQVELLPDGSFTEVHEEFVVVPNVINDEEPYVQDSNTSSVNVKQGHSLYLRRRSPVYSRSRHSRSPERDISPLGRRRGSHSSRRNEISLDRYYDAREHPEPSPCLGVFGMSLYTTERDLNKIFSRYGEVESVQIVYDRFRGCSRGFGFVYFTSTRDASKARDRLKDAVIDSRKVRVDYSVTRNRGRDRHQRSQSPRARFSRSTRRRSPSRSLSRSSRDRSLKRSRSRS